MFHISQNLHVKSKCTKIYPSVGTRWGLIPSWRARSALHQHRNSAWPTVGSHLPRAEAPIIWPSDSKSQLIRKDPDPGKDLRQEEKGTTQDEMVGWHHRLNRHGFGWTRGVGDGQRGLACCGLWGRKESDTTEWWNSTDGSEVKNLPASAGDELFHLFSWLEVLILKKDEPAMWLKPKMRSAIVFGCLFFPSHIDLLALHV